MWEQFSGLDEIWAVGRRKDRLEKLEEKVNIPVRKFALDLSQEKDRELLKEKLVRLKPQVKFLVNAAGLERSAMYVIFLKRPDRNGTGKLYGPDCCYHHGPSFYAAKQPYPAVCLQRSLFASAWLCSICSIKGLCVKLQPGAGRGAEEEKYLCDGSMSGAGGDGILRDRPGRGKTRSDQEAHDGGAKKVVKKALMDSMKGKRISVYGPWMKAFYVLCRIVPHEILMGFITGNCRTAHRMRAGLTHHIQQ